MANDKRNGDNKPRGGGGSKNKAAAGKKLAAKGKNPATGKAKQAAPSKHDNVVAKRAKPGHMVMPNNFKGGKVQVSEYSRQAISIPTPFGVMTIETTWKAERTC